MHGNALILLKICIPNTKRDYYTYILDADLDVVIGARVWVPFRTTRKVGVILGVEYQCDLALKQLKTIEMVLDKSPIIDQDILELCQWVGSYYKISLSEVLPFAIPRHYRDGKMLDHSALPRENIHIKSRSLQQPLRLNDEQTNAVFSIMKHLHHYQCFLLQGVTGSGKTEVYLQVIAAVLASNKQVLVIVPEIGLTDQLITRFTARFSESLAVIHSHLTAKQRRIAWEKSHSGLAKIILGTRAAVFSQIPVLGLIIIDEEHDPSLKQQDTVRYSARDTALMRAYKAKIPIILGSATPSFESLYNCIQNKYQRLVLSARAAASHELAITITDLRNTSVQHGLAAGTLNSINRHVAAGNQVLVFINRRGFAPVFLCHKCGWIADCISCSSHMTVHRQINRLICHHCGYKCNIHHACPKCHNVELIPIGIGTQRLDQFLREYFPKITILRIDRDEIRKPAELTKCLAQMARGEAQIIVGTQMMAKGHHLPNLTLAVIANSDSGFYSQDFRALERLGQLLVQVAGRAGREDKPGEVIIQTYFPHNPSINSLIKDGYDIFSSALLKERAAASLPPYCFLALLRAEGKQESVVLNFLTQAKQHIAAHAQQSNVRILGPAPAPLEFKAHQHRMQLLFKSRSRQSLHSILIILQILISKSKLSYRVRWHIDVDPMDLN